MPARVLLIGLCWLSPIGAASAQEWTRFRGPNGSGQSEAATIPAEWRPSDYNWQVELPGVGHSSPVVWRDKIFLLSGDPDSGARLVLCVQTSDGALLWQKSYPAVADTVHPQNSLASGTPAVDEDHVYAAWATPEDGLLVALTHEGDEAWRLDLGGYISRHGFGSSPIVFEDLVIISHFPDGESRLIAADRQTGAVRWTTPFQVEQPQNATYSTPCIYEPAQGKPQLIVNSWGEGITGVDPRTGKRLWALDLFQNRPVSSPIIAEGLIFASCGEGAGDNYVVAVQPSADGKSASLAYKVGRSVAPYVPSIVAYGDLLFLWTDKGFVSCLDAPSGKVHWTKRVGGNYSGSPIRVRDRIYCVSADGDVVVLAAAKEYQLLGKMSLGEECRSTPAIADGVMYLRTGRQLFSLGGSASTAAK